MQEQSESTVKKILIVEDEPALSEVLTDTLKDEGFEITNARDGEEGLKLALETHPDLILLDILMPKLNGLDMFKKMRQDQEPPISSVIFLTNLNQIEKVADALEGGANTYLVKADTPLELIVEKIKEFFTKKQFENKKH